MISRLGSNVQIYSLDDWGKTLDYWKGLHPSVMVASINSLNDAPRIRDMRDAMPGTLIVGRYIVTVKHGNEDVEIDGAFHTKPQDENYYLVSPENFLNLIKPMAYENVVLYVMNEPSGEVDPVTFDRLVKWLVEVIRLADERKWSLCLPNWGVGHPLLANNDTELDSRLDPVLLAIANAKTKMYWGLHLYAPKDTLKRLEALEASCKRLGIIPPSTIVTEFGFDTANDGTLIDGYHSRGITGTAFARWNIDIIKNKIRRFFEDGWLVGLTNFSWGGLPKWINFDTQRDSGYKITIEEAYKGGELTVNTKLKTGTFPKYYPGIKPVAADYPHLYKVGLPKGMDYRNLRVLPDEASSKASEIHDGEMVRVYDSPTEPDNLMRKWQWCEIVEGLHAGEFGWLYVGGISLIPTLPANAPSTTQEVIQVPAPTVEITPVVVHETPPSPEPAPKTREQRIAEKLKILHQALGDLIEIYEEPVPVST
jgi:hypothetical protein